MGKKRSSSNGSLLGLTGKDPKTKSPLTGNNKKRKKRSKKKQK